MNPVQNIPAPAVPATGGESKAYGLLRMEEADFAKELGLDTLVPENAPQPRDTNGQFIGKETVLVDTTLSKPVEQPAQSETPAEPATPQVEQPAEEAKTETPKRAPLTKYSVVDDAGQPVELPSVKLTFKDNGKDVSYDVEKVVSLAQMNSHNARQVQSLGETLAERDQRLQQYESLAAQYEREVGRMFTDPAVYEEARQTWLAANSPEKRAERAEARLASIESERSSQGEAGRVAEFTSGTIMPAIQQLAQQYDSVTEEDILGRFALAVPAFQVNGKVPLANLPKLQHFVETELAQWAEQVHDRRAQAINAAKADAAKVTEQEKATSQALKRQVGKVLAPVSGNAQSPQAKPTTIKKAADVLNDPMFGGSN